MVDIKISEPLSAHTTFRIGGPASYFCTAQTLDDLKTALKFAKNKKLKVFILGAGSNVLFSDTGFNGVVINLKGAGGVLLSKFLSYCAKKGLSGLEFLAGVPGSLGGAIYMNAGAYGKTIGEFVRFVYAVDYTGKQVKLNKKQCGFGYRKSIFQKKKLIITGAEFDLKKAKPSKIKKTMNEIIKKRLKKQPYNLPSAGSIFKNPKDGYAAELIERAGCKGMKVGDAIVSSKHANFIVNLDKAKAAEIKKLMALVQDKVYRKFQVKLEPEIIEITSLF